MGCMERLGSSDSANQVQQWLSQGAIPPPWGKLSSKGQSDVAACERETGWSYSDNQNQTSTSCEQKYGNEWHAMDSSGNCFNSSMTEYRTANGTLYTCAAFPAYGCGNSTVPNTTITGQREQVWNNSGLRSWIRTDADAARVESLKAACANISSQANVWLPSAGTSSSVDFGMPDPAKCAQAAACASGQYFNGSSCSTTNNYQTSCSSGQYWNGSACVTSETQTNTVTATGSCSTELIGLLGSGCHSMGSGWFDSSMTTYVLSGSQTVKSCTTEFISGCSGTSYTQTQTSCASGQYWNGSSCVSSTSWSGGCRAYAAEVACQSGGCTWYNHYDGIHCDDTAHGTNSGSSCSSGQWWNGTSCTSATSGTDYATAQQGCANAGGTWDSAANYCQMPTTTTSCSSGQYWNGSSCVTSSTQTSCGSGQYWNGSACVATSPSDTVSTDTSSWQQSCASAGGTWDSASNYCQMPSTSSTYTAPSGDTSGSTYTAPSSDSTYTAPSSGSTEGSYTPPPTTTTESAPISYLFCPDGHDWNGAYCVLSPRSPFERYTANVWSALRSLLGL